MFCVGNRYIVDRRIGIIDHYGCSGENIDYGGARRKAGGQN